jgi:hypothetical protein
VYGKRVVNELFTCYVRRPGLENENIDGPRQPKKWLKKCAIESGASRLTN